MLDDRRSYLCPNCSSCFDDTECGARADESSDRDDDDTHEIIVREPVFSNPGLSLMPLSMIGTPAELSSGHADNGPHPASEPSGGAGGFVESESTEDRASIAIAASIQAAIVEASIAAPAPAEHAQSTTAAKSSAPRSSRPSRASLTPTSFVVPPELLSPLGRRPSSLDATHARESELAKLPRRLLAAGAALAVAAAVALQIAGGTASLGKASIQGSLGARTAVETPLREAAIANVPFVVELPALSAGSAEAPPTEAPSSHVAPRATPDTPVVSGSRVPTSAEALTAEGNRRARAGDYARALKAYDRALAVSRAYVPAKLGRAAAIWDSGRRDLAREQYRAIMLDTPASLVPTLVRERAR